MGIWDRLGSVIKSYFNDDADTVFKGQGRPGTRADPDLDAAFEELDDFLNKDKAGSGREKTERSQTDRFDNAGGQHKERLPPEYLRADFAELTVPFGASEQECKEAYKKLLKIHHPDKHAGHEGNFKKATEKSARLNAAYDRICQWRK